MESFGLYIHWPFCQSKCPYCDFNSHVRETIDVARWQGALLSELDHCKREMPHATLKSIFFGGGTPSLMPASLTEALIDKALSLWPSSPTIEITLEANPSSAEASKLLDFRAAGVNRLSLGVQSLKEEALRFLGRRHCREEALKALRSAAHIFDRFSFDLIYARPGQNLEDWSCELTEALSYARGHLSLYQLTIEEGTAFYYAHRRGDFALPSEATAAQFYEMTQEMMESHGLPAYEISNHARQGHEAQHNLIYWRYGFFGAIGPGAHGRLKEGNASYGLKRLKAPETWLSAVEAQGHGTDERVLLKPDEQFEECLMMGLRLMEGVSKTTLQSIDSLRLERLINSAFFKTLMEENMMWQTPTHLGATLKGRLCLNTLLGHLAVL